MPTTTRRGSNVEAKAFFRRQPAQEQTLGVGQDRYKKRVVGKGFDRYFFGSGPVVKTRAAFVVFFGPPEAVHR